MFRYVIALLLINTYYSSLGIPITNVSVLLSTLEKNCGPSFLSKQIQSKIDECSTELNNEIQRIKCFVFYDINSRLCTALGASKLPLKDDYSAQINETQDVNVLCNEAKDWEFTNISAYPYYKASVENVFKREETCGQVCGTNDLTGNSNYYCKYYKWGTGMLKSQSISSTTTTTQVSVAAQEVPAQNPAPVVNNENKELKATKNQDMLDLKVKHDPYTTAVKSNVTSLKPLLENINEPVSGSQLLPDATGVSSSTNQQLVNDDGANKPEDTSSNTNKQQEAPLDPSDANVNQDVLNKPLSGHSQVPYVPVPDKDKDPVLDQPNTKDQVETGLGSDGLDDIHYDSIGEDADDGADVKPEEEKKNDAVASVSNAGINKLPIDEIESLGSANGGIFNKGFYASTNQDGYTEDDDHFFTFFLITVIMVVLLYVLYHNKNKVSKVFFGLMVEGRQAGRRRNSRGHAYRRLDTLEQAMSGNTAAPPSKIIY